MLYIPNILEATISDCRDKYKEINDRLKELYLGKIVIRRRGKFKGRRCKIDCVFFDGGEVLFLARPIRLKIGSDGDNSELLNCSESRTYCTKDELEDVNS